MYGRLALIKQQTRNDVRMGNHGRRFGGQRARRCSSSEIHTGSGVVQSLGVVGTGLQLALLLLRLTQSLGAAQRARPVTEASRLSPRVPFSRHSENRGEPAEHRGEALSYCTS